MTPRRRRLLAVGLILLGVMTATGLLLAAFSKNLLYFYTPTQVVNREAPVGYPFRVGGLVKPGSVKRQPESLKVEFVLTDGGGEVKVVYEGILPDLFREGQGIIATGELGEDGLFHATQVLAKHDENYMPPEVAEALRQQEQQ